MTIGELSQRTGLSQKALRRYEGMGLIYTASAVILGAVFLFRALQLQRDATPKQAMRLFTYSISYVTLLFSAMALDQLVRR